MAISLDEVNRIAKLARLSFTDEQKQKFQHDLSGILDYIDQLQQVQGKAQEVVDPDALNLMRDDVAEELTSPEEFLKQAPDQQDGFIRVKSVMD